MIKEVKDKKRLTKDQNKEIDKKKKQIKDEKTTTPTKISPSIGKYGVTVEPSSDDDNAPPSPLA